MNRRHRHWYFQLFLWAALGCLATAIASCAAPYPEGAPSQLLPQPRDLSYTADGRQIHYVELDGGSARVLLIHGSPGDWQGWAPLMREPHLRERASLIAPDRPGWGQSGYGHMVPDLADQSRLLAPLLDVPGQRTLLVAHSYGAAVALRLALDRPQQVCGLVLVAPTLSADLEGAAWYDHPPIRWLLPRRLRLSWRELKLLPQELRDMQAQWAALPLPVEVVQGDDDSQVDPRTADFAERVFTAQQLRVMRVPGAGHDIPWRQPKLIADTVVATLRRAERTPAAD
jgi:uncharacterized protein